MASKSTATSKPVCEGYVKDLERFERFLLMLLQESFGGYRAHPDFAAYLQDEDSEIDEEVRELMSMTLRHFEEPEEDLLCRFDLSEPLGNMPSAFAERLHRKGYGAEVAIALQIENYRTDRGIDLGIPSLYRLLVELEGKYF